MPKTMHFFMFSVALANYGISILIYLKTLFRVYIHRHLVLKYIHRHFLYILHNVIHLAIYVKSHLNCMAIEVCSHALLTSLYFPSMAMMVFFGLFVLSALCIVPGKSHMSKHKRKMVIGMCNASLS